MKQFSLRLAFLLMAAIAIPLAFIANRYHARMHQRAILVSLTRWRQESDGAHPLISDRRLKRYLEHYSVATTLPMGLRISPFSPVHSNEGARANFERNSNLNPGNFCWETWPWHHINCDSFRTVPMPPFPKPLGKEVDLGPRQVSWRDLWGEQSRVRQVLLAGGWERPEELDQLAELKELQLLTYSICGDEPAVRAIRATQPPFFYAPYATIGDPTCEALAANPRLRGVTILGPTAITDRGAVTLASAPQLQAASFDRCEKIGSTGVAALLAAPKLEWLIVRKSQCDDAALEGGISPKLIHLELEECRLTDAAAERLSQRDSLARLSLCGTQVTDRGALKLARLPNLRWLLLCDTCITDNFLHEAFESPENFPALEWIRVCGTRCTPAERDHIQRLRPNLRVELPDFKFDECCHRTIPPHCCGQ